jgi:hypothetical protein
MRQLFTVLLFSLSLVSFGQQKLNGTYCTPSGFVGYCFTFKLDSLFEYFSWTCLGGENGKGIFKLNNDKLIFNFIDEDPVKNYFKTNQTNCNEVDSITLNFVVFDLTTDETITFPEILLTGSENETLKTSGNVDGIAKIKVKKSTVKSEIKVSYTGFKSFSFSIYTESCQDIKVYLIPHNNQVKAGTKWEYSIIKFDKSSLTLREDELDILFTKARK